MASVILPKRYASPFEQGEMERHFAEALAKLDEQPASDLQTSARIPELDPVLKQMMQEQGVRFKSP